MKVLTRLLLALCAVAQPVAAQHGAVVVDTVKSASLTNLIGDPAQTSVIVYLPPSYATNSVRHYPVVYFLHGYGDAGIGAAVAPIMDSLIAAHASNEMIVVVPNAVNRFGGSFYVNSRTTGRWDDFISRDLVRFVDQHYRTLARPESRGIAGHSMGGYGAFYLGIRHSGTVYGAMYALSACCSTIGMPGSTPLDTASWDALAKVTSFDEFNRQPFMAQVLGALSAAFSPDSLRPPFFFDPEVTRRNGHIGVDPMVDARWRAHATLPMVSRHVASLKRMRGIAFDIGNQDEIVPLAEMRTMDSAMTAAGISHTFETFDGDHSSRLLDRLAQHVMPFFSRALFFR